MSYSAYCEGLNRWLNQTKISMRQNHTGGGKLFVDFAGKTIGVYDPFNGTVRQAQIFVAVWGASNFTYVEREIDLRASARSYGNFTPTQCVHRPREYSWRSLLLFRTGELQC
jgi:transposase